MIPSSQTHLLASLNETLDGCWKWWAIFAAPRILVFDLVRTGLTGGRDPDYPACGSDHPDHTRDKSYCWAGSSDLWADHLTKGT